MRFNNDFLIKQVSQLDFSCGFDVISVDSNISLRIELIGTNKLSITSKIMGWHSEDMVSATCIAKSIDNIVCSKIHAGDGRVVYLDKSGAARKHSEDELIKAYQNKGVAIIVMTEICKIITNSPSEIVGKMLKAARECEREAS